MKIRNFDVSKISQNNQKNSDMKKIYLPFLSQTYLQAIFSQILCVCLCVYDFNPSHIHTHTLTHTRVCPVFGKHIDF